jgi:hypothetical protein
VRGGDVEKTRQLVEVDLGHHRAGGLAPQAGGRHHDGGGARGAQRPLARAVHLGLQRLHRGLEGGGRGHRRGRARVGRPARDHHAPLGIHDKEAGEEGLGGLGLLGELDEVRGLEAVEGADAREGLKALDAAG